MEKSDIIRDSHGFWCLRPRENFLRLIAVLKLALFVAFLLICKILACKGNLLLLLPEFWGLSQFLLMEIESIKITVFLPTFVSYLQQFS